MRNPETVALISKVLEEFDPHSVIDEDEAMFSSRFNDFERQKRKAERAGEEMAGRVRMRATKRVKESYHLERQKREKSEERKRLERELRQAHTDELKK